MEKYVDLTGKRFGRLVVLERNGSNNKRITIWKCLCDCGNITSVIGTSLRRGATRSCGCLCREKVVQSHITHNLTHSRIYSIYHAMRSRCTNPNNEAYANYGGRGIRVCEEWLDSFENFRDWAFSNGYKDDLTVDRIDNNGNYEPSNCRWITNAEQQKNKRTSRYVTYQGKAKLIDEWSSLTGLPYGVIYKRIFQYGWSVDKALSTPLMKDHSHNHKKPIKEDK